MGLGISSQPREHPSVTHNSLYTCSRILIMSQYQLRTTYRICRIVLECPSLTSLIPRPMRQTDTKRLMRKLQGLPLSLSQNIQPLKKQEGKLSPRLVASEFCWKAHAVMLHIVKYDNVKIKAYFATNIADPSNH